MSETNVVYYPRRMRVGWCVAHSVKVMGVMIERYRKRVATYPEACQLAETMNKQTVDGLNKKAE